MGSSSAVGYRQVFDGLVFPGWALEHAAVTETSLMLHYAPELVHMDRMVEEAGATANPMSATLCAKVTFPLTADSPIRPAQAPNAAV